MPISASTRTLEDMEPAIVAVAAVLVLITSLFAARRVARRRIAAGRPNWIWLLFGPTLITLGVGVWVGSSMIREMPVVGVMVVAIGVGTIVFVVRAVHRWTLSPAGAPTMDAGLESSRTLVEGFVWIGLALPMTLAGLLLIVLATGAPAPR